MPTQQEISSLAKALGLPDPYATVAPIIPAAQQQASNTAQTALTAGQNVAAGGTVAADAIGAGGLINTLRGAGGLIQKGAREIPNPLRGLVHEAAPDFIPTQDRIDKQKEISNLTNQPPPNNKGVDNVPPTDSNKPPETNPAPDKSATIPSGGLPTIDNSFDKRVKDSVAREGEDLAQVELNKGSTADEQIQNTNETLSKLATINEQRKAHDERSRQTIEADNIAMRDRINNMKEIDPDHYFKSKGAGFQVTMAIAAGLGALGSGLSGIYGKATPNYALDVIKSSIDRDMDAQKSNLTNEWNKITKGMDLNKDKIAQMHWEEDQMDKQEKFIWLASAKQAEQIAQKTTSKDAKFKADYFRAQADGYAAAIDQKRYDRMMAVQAATAHSANNPPGYKEYKEDWYKKKSEGKAVNPLISPQEFANTKENADLGNVKKEKPGKKTDEEKAREAITMVDTLGNVKSTSISKLGVPNIYARAAEHIQGTPAFDNALQRDVYNQNIIAETHKRVNLRNLPAIKDIAGRLIIEPNDTQETIDRKKRLAKEYFAGHPILEENQTGTPESNAFGGEEMDK